MRMFLASTALGGLLVGCTAASNTPLAEAGINAFHQSLNNQDFEGIYDRSSPDMKAASTKPHLVQFLSAVHRKLGNFESGSVTGWRDNIGTNGHFLSLNYSAKYQQGNADENFVYRLDAGPPLLAGYHVNSDALVLN